MRWLGIVWFSVSVNIVRGVFRIQANILEGVFYWNLLTILAKRFILGIWLVSENTSDRYHCVLQYVPLLESYFNGLLEVK